MSAKSKNACRRAIEREYQAALNLAVPLEKWRQICGRAVEDALDGDSKAREWLSKWLMGTEPRSLTTLAAEEVDSTTVAVADNEIAVRREEIDVRQRKAEQKRQLDSLTCGGWRGNGADS